MVAERKYAVAEEQVFGNLKVLSGDTFYPINGKTGKKVSTRCVMVECTCGYIFHTSIALLVRGKTTSCKFTKKHYEITGESLGAHKHMAEKIKKEEENKILADKEREDLKKSKEFDFSDYIIPIFGILLVIALIYFGSK